MLRYCIMHFYVIIIFIVLYNMYHSGTFIRSVNTQNSILDIQELEAKQWADLFEKLK